MSKHFAKYDVPRYLTVKREGKAVRRRARLAAAAEARSARAEALQEQFGHTSKIVELLASGLPKTETKLKGRLRFTLPRTFSVMDAPEQALAALSQFAAEMRGQRLGQITLDFSKLTQYDLGANGLLDVLVDEISVGARQTGRKIAWRGNYPDDPGHRRFVKAMGVIKRLKIVHEYPSKEEESRLRLFDSRSRHYVRALRPREVDRKGRVTRKFADHINSCLDHVGRALTVAARERLCRYVGEILDNAEQHGGMLDWSIQGYLDPHLATPMCEIVIFNFGKTIAQTFEDLPSDSFAAVEVGKYIDLHRRRRLFGHEWRREDLYTLIALQDRVSSKNFLETDMRGFGTVDLIEFFQQMHAECSVPGPLAVPSAKMIIISGSSSILFDGTYAMRTNPDGHRIIAFNEGNDLHEKPDKRYVRKLDGVNFPGTLISLKFPLSTIESTVPTEHGGASADTQGRSV